MRLPRPDIKLSIALQEFDIWITPNLGEIRDTDKYEQILGFLMQGFELLRQVTEDFASQRHCHPDHMITGIRPILDKLSSDERFDALNTLARVLYLVTGKSDNNVKCQLPLFLRDQAGISTIPIYRPKGIETKPLPRELKAERLMRIVAGLKDYPQQAEMLLRHFLEFILNEEAYVSQLWSIGHSYVALSEIGKEADLLSPLVVFQVRGSVSASGGHDPENVLRERLIEWGLSPSIDFNENDVVLDQLLPADKPIGPKLKTRAYDFVLPYKSWEEGSKLLIQSQFYAGDSGSVSHKNVDQTRGTRDITERAFSEAVFLEYVDGAGYFASLNGDLRSLLSMPDTASFFQIRSAPIRLRRELQAIGFLAPLEVEHAILRAGTNRTDIYELLMDEGYAEAEIERCLNQALEQGTILQSSDREFTIRSDRRPLVRRYFLLDTAAVQGKALAIGDISNKVLVPGYGPFYGLRQNELIRLAQAQAPSLREDWRHVDVAFDDLQWLIDRRFVASGL